MDVSLNHDAMAPFSLHKWPKFQNLGPTLLVLWYKGASLCPWDSIPIAQTHNICLEWMWEAVCGGYQPQPWRYGMISTPQVNLNYQILYLDVVAIHILSIWHQGMCKKSIGSFLFIWFPLFFNPFLAFFSVFLPFLPWCMLFNSYYTPLFIILNMLSHLNSI